ncbi:hypothetical protein WJX74_000764 [Apatococcus lobatus]|uniref:Septin-type G domain-containing protein n=1 Tax=Apatococcus lobatus TaxID=904363 RepID=A0AAW1SDF5_9CHLO
MSSTDLASQHDHGEGEHNGGSRPKGPADNGVRSPSFRESGHHGSKRADQSDRESEFADMDPRADNSQMHTAAEVTAPRRNTNFDNDHYADDLRSAFSGVPRLRHTWIDRYMKMLVVGESGQGKTTFIKNLFASYAQDPDLHVNDASAPTCRDLFINQPERLCTEIIVKDPSNQTAFHYQVQDTPGYENMEDNQKIILDYIEKCHRACLEHEQDTKRTAPISQTKDPRVDLCLYFISPHRMKPADIVLITELSEKIPVIPILAKADCMTGEELKSFRTTVQNKLAQASKDAGRPVVYEFPHELLLEAGARHQVPPFAVIASNTVDLSVGKFWPVRKYPWGTAESLSGTHSDFACLKKLLFEVAYMDLKNATDDRYYKYREGSLLHFDDATMPIDRKSLTRRLHSITNPKPEDKKRLRNFFGTVLKYTASGLVFYTVASFAAGRGHKLQDEASAFGRSAASNISAGASAVGDATQQGAQVVATKAGEAKDAVQDRLTSEEDRLKQEEEERKRKKKGPFGLF